MIARLKNFRKKILLTTNRCCESTVEFNFILNIKYVLLFIKNHSTESLILMQSFTGIEFKLPLKLHLYFEKLLHTNMFLRLTSYSNDKK